MVETAMGEDLDALYVALCKVFSTTCRTAW